MKSLSIAIICGGTSAEAEVSRSSANGVAEALRRRYVNVRLLELNANLPLHLQQMRPEMVFPVLHGSPGEDGTMQGFLEILGLPYVGSGVRASAVAMDKSIAKALFRRIGLPVCEERIFEASQPLPEIAKQIKSRLGDRVVIKPVGQGSGIGVTPLPNGGDAEAALQLAFRHCDQVMVEPYVMGREVTVGVLDLQGQQPQAFAPIEIRTPDGTWYDYEHRYTPGQSQHLLPAPLPKALTEHLQACALAAHKVLGCSDLSRADFIVTDDDQFRLLEVNTMPGMTPTSLYPEAAAHAGLDFEALVDALVDSAYRRATTRATTDPSSRT